MALITNNKLKKEIEKYNKRFLKFYLAKNKYKLKKYKYKEVLYTLPYLAFVINRVYVDDHKSLYDLLNNGQITDTFYNFYFLESTQHAFYDLQHAEFNIEEYKNNVLKLFCGFSEKLAEMLCSEFEKVQHGIQKSILSDLICLLMSYFYTDEIIGNFGPNINKMLQDEAEYNKNVELFALKLEYFKQIQKIIMEADPNTFNYLICGINMVSKDHKA